MASPLSAAWQTECLIRIADVRPPRGQSLDELASPEVAEAYGFSVDQLRAAMAQINGDGLAWKAILLTADLDFGNLDPFATAVAYGGPYPDIQFGIGWWNFRRGTLQPVLAQMERSDPEKFGQAVGDGEELLNSLHNAKPTDAAAKAFTAMTAATPNASFPMSELWKFASGSSAPSQSFSASRWTRSGRRSIVRGLPWRRSACDRNALLRTFTTPPSVSGSTPSHRRGSRLPRRCLAVRSAAPLTKKRNSSSWRTSSTRAARFGRFTPIVSGN
jgi:hypothetical protein